MPSLMLVGDLSVILNPPTLLQHNNNALELDRYFQSIRFAIDQYNAGNGTNKI